jgi:hypothetical protein
LAPLIDSRERRGVFPMQSSMELISILFSERGSIRVRFEPDQMDVFAMG